ncbi:MAG: hypothetical protein GX060_06950 [Firmicutes bacterium]|nr:hypothetical protein [Bacillota bacterium]
MSDLPQAFVQRMQSLLGDDFAAFMATYEQERSYGLRVNTLKLTVADFRRLAPWQLQPIPWCPTGFYYDAADQPGKHPWHAAGLYYLQDPSAMAVAELAAPQPGENVLDLCAAPGGKATHLASLMQEQGLLVANEIHPGRAKILAENLERWGTKRALVTSAAPDTLAAHFGAWFDCVVVDAPCSGEGMFRKDAEARAEWSEANVMACAARQDAILEAAYALLKPGGRLVYSTCTFAVEENEAAVERLLARFPDLEVGSAHLHPAWQPGLASDEADPVRLTARLWPHRLQGEGHFLALLYKAGNGEAPSQLLQTESKIYTAADKELQAFAAEVLYELPPGPYLRFGNKVFQVMPTTPVLDGLRLLRPGWPLGEVRKGRFIPDHSLALGLRAEQVQRCHNLAASDPDVISYLSGQTLATDLPNGWAIVCVDGFPLGWGKVTRGVLKNHYPKGLRWRR